MQNNDNYPPPKKSKAPLRKVSENDTIPTLDSSVVEVCQRVSASQAACPVSLAKRGFAITSIIIPYGI